MHELGFQYISYDHEGENFGINITLIKNIMDIKGKYPYINANVYHSSMLIAQGSFKCV